MNTSQTIGMLFAAGAVLLPSCETERINERPIGIYPTENVYPSGPNALGSQGNSLLSEVQGGNPLDPSSAQNSGFNPDPARTEEGTINRLLGGGNNNASSQPVVPSPTVPNPVGNPPVTGIAPPKPVEPAAILPFPSPGLRAIPPWWSVRMTAPRRSRF